MLMTGTNLQALIDACASRTIPNASIVLVLSNRKAAYGLERARTAGIATDYFALQPYLKAHDGATREDYDAALAQRVLAHAPQLVVLAGWMHIMSGRFLDALESASVPAINLHPALPGAFDGANALQRAWDAWKQGEIRTAYEGNKEEVVKKLLDRVILVKPELHRNLTKPE